MFGRDDVKYLERGVFVWSEVDRWMRMDGWDLEMGSGADCDPCEVI